MGGDSLKISPRVRRVCGYNTCRTLAVTLMCLLTVMWALWILGAAVASAETIVYCTGSDVRLRWEPVNGEVIGYLNKGDAVTLLEVKNGWGNVLVGNDPLWVDLSYLSEIPPDELPETATVTGGRLAMRDKPGGARSGWIKNRQVVKPLAVIGEWMRVEVGGKTGWALMDYLEVKNGE